MIYQLNPHTEIKHYICKPNVVLYFVKSKETTLLSAHAAEIFNYLFAQQTPVSYEQLCDFFSLALEDQEDRAYLSDCLSQLTQIKLIEQG